MTTGGHGKKRRQSKGKVRRAVAACKPSEVRIRTRTKHSDDGEGRHRKTRTFNNHCSIVTSMNCMARITTGRYWKEINIPHPDGHLPVENAGQGRHARAWPHAEMKPTRPSGKTSTGHHKRIKLGEDYCPKQLTGSEFLDKSDAHDSSL